MSTQKTRQWEAERMARVVQIEHAKAFSELAHAVYTSEPPPGGWPPEVQQRIDDCRRVSERMRDAARVVDRATNRG